MARPYNHARAELDRRDIDERRRRDRRQSVSQRKRGWVQEMPARCPFCLVEYRLGDKPLARLDGWRRHLERSPACNARRKDPDKPVTSITDPAALEDIVDRFV